MPVHDMVDIETWVRKIPLANARSRAQRLLREVEKNGQEDMGPGKVYRVSAKDRKAILPGGDILTGPYHAAIVEQCRREMLDESALTRGIPTHAFLWNTGESENPLTTKIGGRFLWKRNAALPVGDDGRNLAFIAQVSFVDSRALVGRLPGDVLLVFGEELSLEVGSVDSLKIEWIKRKEPLEVIANGSRSARRMLRPFFGSLWKTKDYPNLSKRFSGLREPRMLSVVYGTKIGGSPPWIQRPEKVRGRFLCSVGSINPPYKEKFPFMNATSETGLPRRNDLAWSDAGILFLFINKKGGITPIIQYF